MIGSIEVDDLGSHFVLRGGRGARLAEALESLPHSSPAQGHSGRVAPAIPIVARRLRELIRANPALSVHSAAESLLDELDRLPATASCVAHLCEHAPGRLGVIVAGAPDPAVAVAMSRLPEVRHDEAMDRWWIPASRASLDALADQLVALPSVTATPAVRRRIHRFEQPSLSPAAVEGLEHRCRIGVEDPAGHEARLRLCRTCNPDLGPELDRVAGPVHRSFDSWWVTIKADDAPLRQLLIHRPELGVDGRMIELLAAAAAVVRRSDQLERLSTSAAGRTEFVGVAGTLRPFQGAGVEYALATRRTFIADEPGLGKTLQALTTLHVAACLPALVVCPASLRLNWAREAARWIPGRSVGIVTGADWPDGAEIAVVSYDALHRLVEPLEDVAVRAFVLDESHFCKNPRARRTQAAQAIADGLGPEALVLLLTGTPVVNRPAELVSQLRILGRLDVVGGSRRMTRVYAKGLRLDELHRRLRRSCFVRRHKAAVLPQLPVKQRTVVPVELTDRREYDEIQAGVADWLRRRAETEASLLEEIRSLASDDRHRVVSERGLAAWRRAQRAEALVRMTQLTMAAARGKIAASVEWISAFLAADEKLVVFCRHREVGDALCAAFPTAAVATGRVGVDRRTPQIHRFQTDPDCRLIVCSLEAASVGVTLTAASNVAFVEIGWTPAVQDQAEDRLHRIGQPSAVTAWYLLAVDTIDERIAELVEAKRQLVRAATDGHPHEDPSDTVLGQLEGWVLDRA